MPFSLKFGEELDLRLLEDRHAAAVFEVVDRNREYLRQWLPWLDMSMSPDETLRAIRHSLRQFANGDGLLAGIWSHGQVIGAISYNIVDHSNRIARIGYWLASDQQGSGVMTKACRAMVDHAFEELGLNRIEIRCATENAKSRAIPQRLGFKQEGIQRQAEWLYDHFVDLVVYAMLAGDWPDEKKETEEECQIQWV